MLILSVHISIMSTDNSTLKCYCDHCPNNTCITHRQGSCYVRILINRNGETERQSNCFDLKEQLFQNLICGNQRTKISTDITRCCYSKDYCNLDVGILAEIEEAEKNFLSSSNLAQSNVQNHSLTHEASIAFSNVVGDKYSKLPLELKLASITIFGLLLITVIALAQRWHSSRSNKSRKSDENYSENSSVKVNNPETIIYDTNSMASKEPLISSGICQATNNSNRAPLKEISGYTANAQNHPKSSRESKGLLEGKTQCATALTFSIGEFDKDVSETSSGSGSGQPYLTQRSIAHDIELLELVGRGYFGVVWRAEYRGEPVAVKIFSAEAEPSWEREAEIYQTTLLRHKNILGFIAGDKREDISTTGYWLVTDYYPLGSLYDFLKSNSLSISDALRMAFSIANGLAHLHTEIFGTQAKPAIAHRDIKSKNILVRNDGTCCIADLGMAVRYNSSTNIVDVPANTRVGTRRYLSPEILENNLDVMDFEGVKSSDIYSLGLVFWEILRRTCFRQPFALTPQCDTEHRSSPVQQVALSQAIPTDSCLAPPIMIDTYRSNLSSLSDTLLAPSHVATLHSPCLVQSTAVDSPLPRHDCSNLHDEAPQISTGSLNKSEKLLSDDPMAELSKVCDTYEVPYQEFVNLEPSLEEMRHCVCVLKLRPPMSYRWSIFAPMRDFSTLMRECWYDKPQARLSALRIRKTLGDIARHYLNQNMEYD